MGITGKQRKGLIIISSILISLVFLVLIIQLIIGSILDEKIENLLEKKNNHFYSINVRKVKVNLFTMTVIVKDVDIVPDSSFVAQLKAGTSDKNSAFKVNIPVIRIRNIHLLAFLQDKYIDVNKLIIKGASIDMFTAKKKEKNAPSTRQKGDKLFNVDTIMVKGITGVNLNEISVKDVDYRIIDLKNNDTTLKAPGLGLEIVSVELQKNKGEGTGFKLIFKDVDMSLKSEKFVLPGGKYILTFDMMNFSMADSILSFKDLKIAPRYSLTKMVSFSKYQYEIYNMDINEIKVFGFFPRKFINNSRVLISKITIDGLDINIFKDKSKPFDTEKRPSLPQQSLKKLKTNLHVDLIEIKNGKLKYSEKYPDKKNKMEVVLGRLNASIKNISTISDSISSDKNMTIDFTARLQNKLDMGVNVVFDLASTCDTFAFSGYINGGDLKSLNNILQPAVSIKVKSGKLDKLTFSAKANAEFSIGEMTMLYHDLESVVIRNENDHENKFLTWAANKVIIADNPSQNSAPRSVPMYFLRCQYKGIGNFLWKTVQSGVVTTIVPGQTKKMSRNIYEQQGLDSKEILKAERKKKRDKKKLERKDRKSQKKKQ